MEQISNKENILNVSCKLFAFRGYDSVSVQEIAEAAGLSKPTLYYYFGSKLGLLQALIEQKGLKLTEQLEKACEYQHDFINSVIKIIRAELDFAKEEPDYFRLHISLLHAPTDSESNSLYSEIRQKINSIFLEFFRNSANELGNMRGKEGFLSILFRNNLISIAATVLSGFLNDDEETIKNIAHTFVYGVAN